MVKSDFKLREQTRGYVRVRPHDSPRCFSSDGHVRPVYAWLVNAR